jgi:chromosome segregation ATPase
MILKSIKTLTLAGAGLALAGGVIFGTDAVSYLRSGASSVRHVVKDQIPIEFELKRARDLVDDIIPEMQANIRMIAQQEVEISNLRADIAQSQKGLNDEQAKVARLRECLATSQVSFAFGGMHYNREQLKDELGRRFEHLKEAEIVLAGKQRLLENRQKQLHAAMQILEKTRGQKANLESQIATLEGQFRLIQAAQVGSKFSIDNSKLAQTERLIAQIKKQLDVSERVLAHEARFTDQIPVDATTEKDLVAQVDEYLSKKQDNVAMKVEGEVPARQ